MSDIAIARLTEERKVWRQTHPYGFIARPSKNDDGSPNLKIWDCVIPGETFTSWEGGRYKMKMFFSDDYPTSPPKCVFEPPIFHPNVYTSGEVCLPILSKVLDWEPKIAIKDILLGIQTLLYQPDPDNAVNVEAWQAYKCNRKKYHNIVFLQARAMEATE